MTSRFSVELQSGLREGSGYLLPLECLRGVAIVLVFLFHAWGISGLEAPQSPGILLSYILSGSTGVTLFFVLSGFLLFLPWVDTERTTPDIRAYYTARILRIAPLYYVAVLLAVLVTGQWQEGLIAAAFQFVGFDLFPYSVVWWTLVTEVQFYLLLPLFGLAWTRRGVWLWLVAFLLLLWAAAYSVVFLIEPAGKTVFSYWLTKSLFGRFPAFLIGMIAAVMYVRSERHRDPSHGSPRLRLLLVLAATVALGVVLQGVADRGEWLAEWSWHIHHTWEALLWVSLVMLSLKGFSGMVLLVNRFWAVLGKLSYSFYLWHVPVLFYVIDPIKSSLGERAYQQSTWLLLLPVVALGLTVLVSYLTFRLIELPFLNLKRQLRH